jgi:hypothetical protein
MGLVVYLEVAFRPVAGNGEFDSFGSRSGRCEQDNKESEAGEKSSHFIVARFNSVNLSHGQSAKATLNCFKGIDRRASRSAESSRLM